MKCIICDKQRKTLHKREQPLQTCVTQETINLLKTQANEMGDTNLLNKINVKYTNNATIFYYRHSKQHYENALQSEIGSVGTENSEWH